MPTTCKRHASADGLTRRLHKSVGAIKGKTIEILTIIIG